MLLGNYTAAIDHNFTLLLLIGTFVGPAFIHAVGNTFRAGSRLRGRSEVVWV